MKTPAHPGRTILHDWLEPLGLSAADAAAHLGVSRSCFGDVLAGAAGIDADLAVRLAMAFGQSPRAWLGRQADWDLAQAERGDIQVDRLHNGDPWEGVPDARDGEQEARTAGGAPRGCGPGVPGETPECPAPADAAIARLHEEWRRSSDDAAAAIPRIQRTLDRVLSRVESVGAAPRAPFPRLPPRVAYAVLVDGEEGAHTVLVPDLPGCTAGGATYAQALEAASRWIAFERAAGRKVPEARDLRYMVRDPAIAAMMNKGALLELIRVEREPPPAAS